MSQSWAGGCARSLAHGRSQLWRVGCRSDNQSLTAVICCSGEFYLCKCVMPRAKVIPIERLTCTTAEGGDGVGKVKENSKPGLCFAHCSLSNEATTYRMQILAIAISGMYKQYEVNHGHSNANIETSNSLMNHFLPRKAHSSNMALLLLY